MATRESPISILERGLGRKLRVVALTQNYGFCFFYRIKWPMMALFDLGLVDFIAINPAMALDMVGQAILEADVIIFHYAAPAPLLCAYADLIKKFGHKKIIVSEFDDDYMSINPVNQSYRYYGTEDVYIANGTPLWKDGMKCNNNGDDSPFSIEKNKERIEQMKHACDQSDAISVTTGHLADAFKFTETPKLILGNYIYPDEEIMPMGEKNNDILTIGWQGGDSHYEDLHSIIHVLERIKDRYGDKVKFKFWGAEFVKLFSRVDGEHVKWCRPIDFLSEFSKNLPDIGIVPLVDNKFNRAKSNIKWLEYSYYAIPSVVAREIPYSTDGIHGETLLYYQSPGQMYKNLCLLIEDEMMRKSIGEKARQYVLKNYDIRNKCIKWYDCYIRLLKGKEQNGDIHLEHGIHQQFDHLFQLHDKPENQV